MVNNLDEDQILFEDKKTQLKSIVKKEKLKKEIDSHQKQIKEAIKFREDQQVKFMLKINQNKEDKSSMPDQEYNSLVDDIGSKMNFVKACFDTMYFLNEDNREEQLKSMLKGKGVKLRKSDKKPKKQYKEDNPFR